MHEHDSDTCLWANIMTCAKERSMIITNETEYYNRVDPSRVFREMDMRNLATKLEELDVETSCSDSDSDNNSEDNSDADDNSDGGEPERGGLDDGLNVPVQPIHSAVFASLIDDSYAMSVLHLSATEFPDENVEDFELFKDSHNISTEYVSIICFSWLNDYLDFYAVLFFVLDLFTTSCMVTWISF